MNVQEELRRLAWDLLTWAQDSPLQLDAVEQTRIAEMLTLAAERIDSEGDGSRAATSCRRLTTTCSWLPSERVMCSQLGMIAKETDG